MATGRVWPSIVVALALVTPVAATAQDQDTFQQQAAAGTLDPGFVIEQLPAVYVTDATFSVTNEAVSQTSALGKEGPLPSDQPQDVRPPSSNALTGTFTITNQDSRPQTGLRYELLIIDAAQAYEVEGISVDDPRIYYRLPIEQPITIAANSSQEITLQQEVPPLPEAPYRARIQVLTADGRQLGWYDAPVVLGGLGEPFVSLTPSAINVSSRDGVTGEVRSTWSPAEGVAVDPGQPLELELTADASGTTINEPLTPRITMRRQLVTSLGNDSASVVGEAVTISSTGSQALTLPVQASADPGPHLVSVALLDASGEVRSTTAEYMYVTRGATASIVSQSLIGIRNQPNPSAEVSFTIAGSADRETDLNGSVEVALLVNGEVVGTTESTLALPAGQTKAGTATLALDRKVCSSPDIRTTVKDNQGKVLAQQQAVTFADVSCGLNYRSPFLLTLVAGAAILIIIILALMNRGRSHGPTPPAPTRSSGTIVGSFLILAIALSLLSEKPALANGIQWQSGNTGYALSLFINKPQHQATANAQLGLDYEARLTYTASNAIPAGAQLNVYLLAEGGHVESPNSRSWTRIGGGNAAASSAQNPRTLSLTSRLPLPAGYNHSTSTLWTTATVGEGAGATDGRTVHDLTWVTLDYGPGGAPGQGTGSGSCLTPQVAAVNTNACQEARVTFKVKNTCQPSAERPPLDVMLVLDRSGSMGNNNKITNAKVAAHILINQLDPSKDRVGLVSYADFASLDIGLTSNLSQVNAAVNHLQPYGWTNVANGVFQGRSELLNHARAGATPVMIVLTDGIANRQNSGAACESYPTIPTACTQDAITQAASAKTAGVTVFTVGFDLGGATVPRNMLVQMASSGSQAFDAPSATQLQGAFSAIAQAITNTVASNVVITYALPPGVSYAPNSGSPVPSSVTGQTLTWNLGILSVGQELTVSFAVSFADGRSQPISVSPDSRLTYTDNKNQSQAVIAPTTTHSPISCTASTPTPTSSAGPAQCSDGLDNDGDGRVDAGDPACHPPKRDVNNPDSYVPTHTSEIDVECSDTIDNADPEDTLADKEDQGCYKERDLSKPENYNPADTNEQDDVPDPTPGGFGPENVQEVD